MVVLSFLGGGSPRWLSLGLLSEPGVFETARHDDYDFYPNQALLPLLRAQD